MSLHDRPLIEQMAVAYATEIERLRAEAAQAEQNWAADWKHEVEKLEAEIDRLRLSVATLKDECRGRAANEDKLRAALMKICTMQGEPIQIARKALANGR